MEAHSKAKLVDAPAPAGGGGITATLSRSEIEETLKSADGPALLFLDIARVRNGGSEQADVEARTLEVEMETPDLEQLLRTTSGDEIALRFDPAELEQALEEDVEGHGLREKAVILTVAAATAAGVAGQAKAMRADAEGGPVATAVSAPISDVMSGGPAASQAAEQTAFVTDVTSGGAPAQAADETQLISDVMSGGPASSQAAESTPLVSDVVSGGPAPAQAAESTPLVSDVVSGGPAPAQAAESTGGGGGISISAPDAWTAGAAGGLALLITGASLAARRQRRPAQT